MKIFPPRAPLGSTPTGCQNLAGGNAPVYMPYKLYGIKRAWVSGTLGTPSTGVVCVASTAVALNRGVDGKWKGICVNGTLMEPPCPGI